MDSLYHFYFFALCSSMFMFHETLLSRMQEIFKIKKDMLLFTPQKD